jgi:phosphomannomutase/phosphoglucomutase
MGIALDGDGDRVVLVDHRGAIVRPEQLAVLIQQHCFGQPTVVYDLKSASILARAIEASGGTARMRPSGYGFIKSTMIDTRAEMGVEASGHHFFGVLDGGDDGLFTALVALEIVRRTGTTLADLIRPIGWPAITPDLRIPFSGDTAAAIETIAGHCGGQISRLDGVRAQYEHGWALARPSITEPAITLRFEGRTNDDLRQIASRFLVATPDLLRRVLEEL